MTSKSNECDIVDLTKLKIFEVDFFFLKHSDRMSITRQSPYFYFHFDTIHKETEITRLRKYYKITAQRVGR